MKDELTTLTVVNILQPVLASDQVRCPVVHLTFTLCCLSTVSPSSWGKRKENSSSLCFYILYLGKHGHVSVFLTYTYLNFSKVPSRAVPLDGTMAPCQFSCLVLITTLLMPGYTHLGPPSSCGRAKIVLNGIVTVRQL